MALDEIRLGQDLVSVCAIKWALAWECCVGHICQVQSRGCLGLLQLIRQMSFTTSAQIVARIRRDR